MPLFIKSSPAGFPNILKTLKLVQMISLPQHKVIFLFHFGPDQPYLVHHSITDSGHLNWPIALQAPVANINLIDLKRLSEFDIICVPFDRNSNHLNIVHQILNLYPNKIIVGIQEGDCLFFESFSRELQFLALSILNRLNLLIAHSEISKTIFQSLTNIPVVHINNPYPTHLIDSDPDIACIRKIPKKNIIYAGGWGMLQTYNGLLSILSVVKLNQFELLFFVPGTQDIPIIKRLLQDYFHNFKYSVSIQLKTHWKNFLRYIREAKYAFLFSRIIAGKRLAMDCAMIGTVLLSGANECSDLFPETALSFECLHKVPELIKKLETSPDYYDEIINHSCKVLLKNYGFEHTRQNFWTAVNEFT